MKYKKAFSIICIALSAILIVGAANDGAPKKPKGGKYDGKYYPEAGIFAEGKNCKVDSAAGKLIRFDQAYPNPLFESKLPNMTHLLLWFKDGLMTGQRYQLPDPAIEVCYWEQGDLLMFHTNKALGWIEFGIADEGQKLKGKMDMKLIEPDHNMSNSDYHYMGGAFTASPSELEAK